MDHDESIIGPHALKTRRKKAKVADSQTRSSQIWKSGTLYYPLHASGTPPQTTTGRASKKTRKKERVHFSGSTIGLVLSPAADQIKGSPQYCRIAHHLACLQIHFFCRPHVRLRSSVNPAAAIVGGNWGESGVSAALGDISCPDQPSGVCSASPLDRTYPRVTGTSWISSLLLRGMVPC